MLLSRDLQSGVYPVNNTGKQVGIDLLGEGISGSYCPLLGLRLDQRLRHKNDPPMAQPTHQPLRIHTQQLTEDCQVRVTELEDTQKYAFVRYQVKALRSGPSEQMRAETHGN